LAAGLSGDAVRSVETSTLGAQAEILRAHPKEAVAHLLPSNFAHPGPPERSVVLIDEIDKASRDFPNDLLNELDLRRVFGPAGG